MTRDQRIFRIASQHNRVITWDQLVDAGISRRAIAHRVRTGRLYRRHTGVYLLDPIHQASRLTVITAAVAAYGPDAVLSHASAAELWGFLPACPGPIDVTVVGRNPGLRAGIRRHRTSTLEPSDIRTRHRIRVTSPVRTALDNACHPDLEQLLATAFASELMSEREIEAEIDRNSSRPGMARLSAIVHQSGGPRWTRSWAERRILALVRQAGLPVPETNVVLHGYLVDAVWPEHKLVLEVDSWEFHRNRRSFENDRARDAVHVAAGYRVIRITAIKLRDQPLVVVGQLAAALALASATNARTSADSSPARVMAISSERGAPLTGR